MHAAAIAAEQERLAHHYATLGIPVCTWGTDEAVDAWLALFKPTTIYRDLTSLSFDVQDERATQLAASHDERIVCVVEKDPHALVSQGALTPALAQQLLCMPLQLV